MCDFDWASLETEVDADGNFKPKSAVKTGTREKFPCEHCNGTGNYQGVRLHQDKEHCFACRGKGYFYTSKYDRQKTKQQRAERKARKETEAREAAIAELEASDPGLIDFLNSAAEWSEFASSLQHAFFKWNGLTEKQLNAVRSMRAKCEARQAERETAKQDAVKRAAQTTPTLEVMARAFLSSSAHLKFPKLRLATEDGAPVVLTRCGSNSRTPGHINITDGRPYGENQYYGRIDPEGRAFLRDTAPDPVKAVLKEFNDNPEAAIKVQGLRTGQCCCCGRELTDPVSIERGIGPICADKWGF